MSPENRNPHGNLIIIKPLCPEPLRTKRLDFVMEQALEGRSYEVVSTAEEFEKLNLTNKRFLFVISLGESGINLSYYEMLKKIRLMDGQAFSGSVAGLIVDSNGELYTKSVARELVFAVNKAGCTFVGRPLVEGTKSLYNFNVVAKVEEIDNLTAYCQAALTLVANLSDYRRPKYEAMDLMVVHASDPATSNTLALWELVKEELIGLVAETQAPGNAETQAPGNTKAPAPANAEAQAPGNTKAPAPANAEAQASAPALRIKEISLRETIVTDCKACSYETCVHMGKAGGCVYGGGSSRDIYASLLQCNALVVVCPNYNDALGANITAFINCLTALFRVYRFYDKQVFAVIVSGYSGGDIVAQQIISALNMNKTFSLPGNFALLETANNPKAILDLPGVRTRAKDFALNIFSMLEL